jgi:hypothetical protein
MSALHATCKSLLEAAPSLGLTSTWAEIAPAREKFPDPQNIYPYAVMSQLGGSHAHGFGGASTIKSDTLRVETYHTDATALEVLHAALVARFTKATATAEGLRVRFLLYDDRISKDRLDKGQQVYKSVVICRVKMST